MEFIARQDIEAPIAWVFQQAADFSAFERQAMRRGADVRRLDSLPRPGSGSAWDVQFRFRGKDRQLRAEVGAYDPPNGYAVAATSPNLEGRLVMELVALSRSRTRLTVRLDVAAKTLPARLLLQSLRLAKAPLNTRFDTRVASFAKEIQDRHGRRAAARA